jgi:hypothetical protein
VKFHEVRALEGRYIAGPFRLQNLRNVKEEKFSLYPVKVPIFSYELGTYTL